MQDVPQESVEDSAADFGNPPSLKKVFTAQVLIMELTS